MKRKLHINYGYLANYAFSISLAFWSITGISVSRAFFGGAPVLEVLSTSPERLIVFIISVVLALVLAAIGLFCASKDKYNF